MGRQPGVERIDHNSYCYTAHAKEVAGHRSFEVVEIGAGWPLISLVAQYWEDKAVLWMFNAPNVRMLRIEDTKQRISRQSALPCFPLWPGFAVNTVIYAAVLCGLVAAPFALRRRWRAKRSLCPKCAYDLRGRAPSSTACPECGTAVADELRLSAIGSS